MSYLLVFFGGGIGAGIRYWMQGVVYRITQSGFPYGTLAVNVSGCFAIGFLMIAFEERFLVNPSLRLFLTIGILGGFTTFSSFSYETIAMFRDGELFHAMMNMAGSLSGCLVATYLGVVAGKFI